MFKYSLLVGALILCTVPSHAIMRGTPETYIGLGIQDTSYVSSVSDYNDRVSFSSFNRQAKQPTNQFAWSTFNAEVKANLGNGTVKESNLVFYQVLDSEIILNKYRSVKKESIYSQSVEFDSKVKYKILSNHKSRMTPHKVKTYVLQIRDVRNGKVVFDGVYSDFDFGVMFEGKVGAKKVQPIFMFNRPSSKTSLSGALQLYDTEAGLKRTPKYEATLYLEANFIDSHTYTFNNKQIRKAVSANSYYVMRALDLIGYKTKALGKRCVALFSPKSLD